MDGTHRAFTTRHGLVRKEARKKPIKQHITIDQLNELTAAAQERFQAWWYPDVGDWVAVVNQGYASLVRSIAGDKINLNKNKTIDKNSATLLPSIGQLLDYLDEHDNDDLGFRLHLLLHEETSPIWSFDTDALPTTLWEGVKTTLEHDAPNERTNGGTNG